MTNAANTAETVTPPTPPRGVDIQRAYCEGGEDRAWAFVEHTEKILWDQDEDLEMVWTFSDVEKHGKAVVLVEWWAVKIPNRCDLSLG